MDSFSKRYNLFSVIFIWARVLTDSSPNNTYKLYVHIWWANMYFSSLAYSSAAVLKMERYSQRSVCCCGWRSDMASNLSAFQYNICTALEVFYADRLAVRLEKILSIWQELVFAIYSSLHVWLTWILLLGACFKLR